MQPNALSYVVIKAREIEAWRVFGQQVLGMRAQDVAGGLALRMDERAGRLFVEKGEEDRYFASGWELHSAGAFHAAKETLARHGVTCHQATQAERDLRHVFDMVWFHDPAGNRHELAYGYVSDFERFVSPVGVSGFVTGDLGLGHAVLPAPNIHETRDFLTNILGFGLADILVHRPAPGIEQRIDFMHCGNARHHSLALFEGPVPAGCVHLMVEVESLDEVGRAYDRMVQQGVRLMATLGKHSNDHVTSFYFASPGGFAIEYGFGGRAVDWDRHSVFESTSVSLWGHDFSVGFGADEQRHLVDAA
ncbi:VOC family protein [Sphingobium sp. EM0848]|uniref:VOC family protein n=1 Tax=Sphingobium sp. EM0848 TaxID=2743473 RepID=UPI00159CB7E6|nr:VOC family protein [Sphingobium sp. EM0848]